MFVSVFFVLGIGVGSRCVGSIRVIRFLFFSDLIFFWWEKEGGWIR